ncbi:MAG: DUF1573 domain-containing protein [Prolixibacteraceae bacterium]|nr:DUF1573 domain-containing protein [Prolixibacteraceae bacterium]
MKSFFALMILLFLTGAAFAQEAQTVQADTTAKATIVFENVEYDFGNIKPGSNAECVFKFENKGSLPLVISRVAASCGCTTPSWTKEPVLPGKTGEIKVKYDTSRIGMFSKTITVISNAETSSVLLRINGSVK